MEKHTKVYLEFFDYQVPEDAICEVTGEPAQDVHHIYGRGPGKDTIENLMGLSRRIHRDIHEGRSPYTRRELSEIHQEFMRTHKKGSFF